MRCAGSMSMSKRRSGAAAFRISHESGEPSSSSACRCGTSSGAGSEQPASRAPTRATRVAAANDRCANFRWRYTRSTPCIRALSTTFTFARECLPWQAGRGAAQPGMFELRQLVASMRTIRRMDSLTLHGGAVRHTGASSPRGRQQRPAPGRRDRRDRGRDRLRRRRAARGLRSESRRGSGRPPQPGSQQAPLSRGRSDVPGVGLPAVAPVYWEPRPAFLCR